MYVSTKVGRMMTLTLKQLGEGGGGGGQNYQLGDIS